MFENLARKYLRDELEKVSFVGFSEMYRLTLLPDLIRIAVCSLAPPEVMVKQFGAMLTSATFAERLIRPLI